MSNRTDIKIFIASSGELADERKESIIVLADLNKRYPHLHLEPVLFEIDTPSGNFPWKKRIQDGINPLLDEAHIVVVLFYSKAGEFTREEFDLALSQQKKVYLYLKEGFAPRNTEEAKKYFEVLEVKEKIEKESVLRYQSYKILNDYYNLLYRDLEKYIDVTYPAPANAPSATISTSRQHIPIAPRPYLAHPYSIIKNFTGRREEMTRLTEWYKFEKEPMCIIEAIGGMGKSSLCWKWMQDEIIATDTKVEGVVWWSFYDQGFEDFIHHAYEYCIPENIRNQERRIDETTEVINALTNHRFLLVLDGFERVLRGYAQMMAMYIQEEALSKKNIDEIKESFDIRQRTPITPKAERVLRALCVGSSKTLMTTRLYPATIEGLAGTKHIKLTGLSKKDTITFFKSEEILGTDQEMIRAGEVYHFHPLMLKLLSTAIKRSFTKNIKKAFTANDFTKALIDNKEPQKILITTYNLLNSDEKKIVATLSVFRTAFTFNAAKALFPKVESEKLEEIMMELYKLGFILYNEQQGIFDFHPILRSYLYDGLTSKDNAHKLAISYFTALPSKEKVITLSDLEPVIEQYYHLIRARKFDDALILYYNRLNEYLLHQLAQYELCINLCKQFFDVPSDLQPKVSKKNAQSFILNELGLCSAVVGYLNEANESWKKMIINNYGAINAQDSGLGFKNLSELVFTPSGKLSQGIVYLLKSEILLMPSDPFTTALAYIRIAKILTLRACYNRDSEGISADNFLNKAMEFGIECNEYSIVIFVAVEYTKWALDQINHKDQKYVFQIKALNFSLKAMKYSEQFRVSSYPVLNQFLNTYEALGRALISVMHIKVPLSVNIGQIFFYDEHFQHIIEDVIPDSSNYSSLAERCVQEGLTLVRRINEVFPECTFLLLYAQVEWQKIINNQKAPVHIVEVEKWIYEAHSLAERFGFRILLSDLHLFCAETLINIRKLDPTYTMILNLSVREHLEKARNYAKDTSSIEDIFLPPDGSADNFYKNITDYQMLKRGMTGEERIKNGYYAAWLRADKLEEQLK